MDKPPTRTVVVQRHDRLKHFSRDGPVIKLIALFFLQLPAILIGAGSFVGACLSVAKVAGWL
jgi:hypothetical protein